MNDNIVPTKLSMVWLSDYLPKLACVLKVWWLRNQVLIVEMLVFEKKKYKMYLYLQLVDFWRAGIIPKWMWLPYFKKPHLE